MEVVVRVGFAAVAPEVFAAGVLGGLVVVDRLCLEVRGAFFTPSDTDARGRAAEEDLRDMPGPAGETTDARVPGLTVAALAGFVFVDEDNDGFDMGGADGFVGTTDALRFGAAVLVVAGREEAMAGLDCAADGALVDFLRGKADTGVGLEAEDEEVTAGLVVADLTDPAPNVPELIIYKYKDHVKGFFTSTR